MMRVEVVTVKSVLLPLQKWLDYFVVLLDLIFFIFSSILFCLFLINCFLRNFHLFVKSDGCTSDHEDAHNEENDDK
jgi:hypothetical protein